MSLPKTFPLKAADGKTISIPSVGFGTWASGGSFFMLYDLQTNNVQEVLGGARMPLLQL
jgi:hypothetical protein